VSQIVSGTPHQAVVFGGDLNFDFNVGGVILPHISQFMLQLGLSYTQDLFYECSVYCRRADLTGPPNVVRRRVTSLLL